MRPTDCVRPNPRPGREDLYLSSDRAILTSDGTRSRNRISTSRSVDRALSRCRRNCWTRTVSGCRAEDLENDAIAKDTHFRTDESGVYWKIGEEFASHTTVIHSIGEYVRGDAHTNTIEGYFSILKRGIYGVYHHVSQQHLKRYLAEFDFRYNQRIALGVDDIGRTTRALRGIVGKRLTYRQSPNPTAD
jgi:hypothetical protein